MSGRGLTVEAQFIASERMRIQRSALVETTDGKSASSIRKKQRGYHVREVRSEAPHLLDFDVKNSQSR